MGSHRSLRSGKGVNQEKDRAHRVLARWAARGRMQSRGQMSLKHNSQTQMKNACRIQNLKEKDWAKVGSDLECTCLSVKQGQTVQTSDTLGKKSDTVLQSPSVSFNEYFSEACYSKVLLAFVISFICFCFSQLFFHFFHLASPIDLPLSLVP